MALVWGSAAGHVRHSFHRDEIPRLALALPLWLRNDPIVAQLKSTSPPARTEESMSVYKNFEIETFELGPNQWHACFRNIDRSRPIVIDDTSFGTLHVGVAWPTSEAALLDARAFIDRMIGRLKVAA
jgi:hypothetical protein